jgi:uncharacterized membrane protein YhaH (DUF805 family)
MMLLLVSLIEGREKASEMSEPQVAVLAFVAVGVLITFYALMYIVRPRCKDAGIPSWLALLMLLPYLNLVFGIILLCRKTQSEKG